VSIDEVSQVVRAKFIKKIGEEKTNANIEGIKRAYNELRLE
jgi:hypothetical protein